MIGFDAVPRYAELVSRLTGESEISPAGLILELDRPEWSVLKNELLWFSYRGKAALAANFSIVGARPGTLPERLVVVTEVWIINNTAGALTYKIGMVTDLVEDGSSRAASRDLRRLGVQTVIFDRNQVADPAPSVIAIPVPANTIQIVTVPWILSKNSFATGGLTQLIVEGGIVNQAVNAAFFGRERFLRPEERVID